jgi:hypothetical protein
MHGLEWKGFLVMILGKYNTHKSHKQVFINDPYGYGFKFYDFISVIFDYWNFNHLCNFLKLSQNPYWKMLLLVGMVKSIWKS